MMPTSAGGTVSVQLVERPSNSLLLLVTRHDAVQALTGSSRERARAAAVGERPDVLRGRRARRHDRALPALVQVPPVRRRRRLRRGPAVALRPVLRLHAELAVGHLERVEGVPRHELPAVAVLEMGAHRRAPVLRRRAPRRRARVERRPGRALALDQHRVRAPGVALAARQRHLRVHAEDLHLPRQGREHRHRGVPRLRRLARALRLRASTGSPTVRCATAPRARAACCSTSRGASAT